MPSKRPAPTCSPADWSAARPRTQPRSREDIPSAEEVPAEESDRRRPRKGVCVNCGCDEVGLSSLTSGTCFYLGAGLMYTQSQTPMWRTNGNGKTDNSGARLCNACGIHVSRVCGNHQRADGFNRSRRMACIVLRLYSRRMGRLPPAHPARPRLLVVDQGSAPRGRSLAGLLTRHRPGDHRQGTQNSSSSEKHQAKRSGRRGTPWGIVRRLTMRGKRLMSS